MNRHFNTPRALAIGILTEIVRLPGELAVKVWDCIERLPESESLRYQLGYTFARMSANASVRRRALDRLLDGPMSPAALVSLLETLVTQDVLTRHEVTQIEDKLFMLTTAQGQWV